MKFFLARNLITSVNQILQVGGAISFSSITVALLSSQAQAAILSVTGSINSNFNPPPSDTSLLEGNVQNNRFIFAFDEEQNISGAGLALDIIDIRDDNQIDDPSTLSPGYINSGEVSSHILHFDPNQARLDSPIGLSGTITFDKNIIGIMVLSETLDLSDDLLGLDNIFYPTGVIDYPPGRNRRGLGFGEIDKDGFEFIHIVDSNTLALNLTAFKSVDQVRVITSSDAVISTLPQSVPERVTLGALIFGCLLGIINAQCNQES